MLPDHQQRKLEVNVAVRPTDALRGAYVLERDGRACAYCDAKGVPLNLDHVVPRACGGSDRASNLVASCMACNLAKGKQPLEAFLAHDPPRLARIKARLQAPLSDAAAAGQLSKLAGWPMPVLAIHSAGRGTHARTRTDAYGFARLRLPRTKTVRGFRTGDLVRATIPTGKKAGTQVGRVAVCSRGSFNIQTAEKTLQGVGARHCCVLQRDDGYGYQPCRPNPIKTGAPADPLKGRGVRAEADL